MEKGEIKRAPHACAFRYKCKRSAVRDSSLQCAPCAQAREFRKIGCTAETIAPILAAMTFCELRLVRAASGRFHGNAFARAALTPSHAGQRAAPVAAQPRRKLHDSQSHHPGWNGGRCVSVRRPRDAEPRADATAIRTGGPECAGRGA